MGVGGGETHRGCHRGRERENIEKKRERDRKTEHIVQAERLKKIYREKEMKIETKKETERGQKKKSK